MTLTMYGLHRHQEVADLSNIPPPTLWLYPTLPDCLPQTHLPPSLSSHYHPHPIHHDHTCLVMTKGSDMQVLGLSGRRVKLSLSMAAGDLYSMQTLCG